MKDCVSLDIAKKLKEAGWAQEPVSEFYYAVGNASGTANLRTEMFSKEDEAHFQFFAAPTSGELLAALPKFCGVVKHDENEFQAYKLATNLDYIAPNPADALALLWVALKEKGLV